MRPVFLTLLILLGAPGAHAQEEYTRDWHRLESDHFRLVGNASEKAIRRVGEKLEEFRSAVLTLMPGLEQTWQTETTVVVFRHEAAFSPFKPEDDITGYFTAGSYSNYIALMGDRDLERTIYHEYVHQLTREHRDWPLWLSEGMAEFYSTLETSGRQKILVGRGIGSHIEWLQRVIIPLEEFLHPETRYEGDDRIRSLYAQGWAFFHYLQLGRPGGVRQLNEFSRLMAASGNNVVFSVQGGFGVDVETLEEDFVSYLRNALTLPAREMTLEERLPEIDLPDPFEIGESEASFYLGDLMAHIGHDEQAELYLGRSLELGGEFEPALTSLYLLRERQGRTEEAAAFLDRALKARRTSWLPYLLNARNALIAGPYEDVAPEAEVQLREVVDQQPQLPDGHFWLGQLLMQRPATLDAAIAELDQAVTLSGGDPLMRVVHARAIWNSGDDERALELLANLNRTTSDTYARDQARQLEEQIRARAAHSRATRPLPEPGSSPGAAQGQQLPTLDRREDTPARPPTSTGIPAPVLPEGTEMPEGMEVVEGRITFIGCVDVFELIVDSGSETLRLSAPGLEAVQLTSYTPAVRGEMPCGEMDPPLPARVIYRLGTDAASGEDGEPVRVDFLP